MKIVTAAEMREIDRVTSERFGVPSLTLMENAGKAVADHVLTKYAGAGNITVICGKGNNGGDGFVAARHLQQLGKQVRVVLLANPKDLRGDAAAMFRDLPLDPVSITSEDEFSSERVCSVFNADLYVDAVLGTGFKPPVTGLYAEAIVRMNAAQGRVVAVDVPSGADADAMGPDTMGSRQSSIARADSVLTFTAPRPAHVFASLTDGPTCVANIGSPQASITSSQQLNIITPHDIATLVAPRPRESNKGNYGHALIIGGSLGKAGAAAMAGISALRAGAGLSTVATSQTAVATVAGFHPELMTEPLPETESGAIATVAGLRIDELLKTMTVVAIGPGISRDPHTATLVRSVVAHTTIPTVVDADGLNAFDGHTSELSGKGKTVVITPHPGEMARLAACSIADVQKDRLGTARRFAREHSLTVVLKGHRTLVVQPDGEVWVNTTGNPGMSTGGTGDVLTGMVAGLIAQNPKDPFTAVCAAVYLHGRAGDVMRDEVGEHSMIATDLLRGLPEAFRLVRQESQTNRVCWT